MELLYYSLLYLLATTFYIAYSVEEPTLSRLCRRLLCDKALMSTCRCQSPNVTLSDMGQQALPLCTEEDFHYQLTNYSQSRTLAGYLVKFICKLEPSLKPRIKSILSAIFQKDFDMVKRETITIESINLVAQEQPRILPAEFYDQRFLSYTKVETPERLIQQQTVPKNNLTFPEFKEGNHNNSNQIGQSNFTNSSLELSANLRKKRSNPRQGETWFTFGLIQSQQITWRLVEPYEDSLGVLTETVQRDEIKLAFATWERNSKICFQEKLFGNVHVSIKFRPSVEIPGNSPATTSSTNFIYLNKALTWVRDSSYIPPVSTSAAILRTVVQHEVGHLVGFGHNSASQVMRADYNRNVNAAISLSNLDLVNLKNTYGRCTGPFHTITDIQWISIYADGSIGLFYRTLITRNSLVWQYSNLEGKPNGGYPLAVTDEFPGLVGTPSAIFQIYTYEPPLYVDYVYVIKGSQYQKFIARSSGMRSLQESGSITKFGLPRTIAISAAYYDIRDKHIYFFTGSMVHKVLPLYDAQGLVSGYLRKREFSISQLFPMDSSQPNGQQASYQTRIDSVYVHVTQREAGMYMTSGLHIWQNINFQFQANSAITNKMRYLGTQSQGRNSHLWDYVCDPYSCK